MTILTRGVRTTAVFWGDTNTWCDWAVRVLTISDGSLPAATRGIPGFERMWSNNELVFRAHACVFKKPHFVLHNAVETVSARPRIVKVGNTSCTFECLITAIDDATGNEEAVASTRGVLVRVDPETQSHTQPFDLETAAALRERAEVPLDEPPFFTKDYRFGRSFEGPSHLIRTSDADALGHVNNAKWAHLVQDSCVFDGVEVMALAIDYVSPARPGDTLASEFRAARVTPKTDDHRPHFARKIDFKTILDDDDTPRREATNDRPVDPSTRPCTTVTILERPMLSPSSPS